jgi:para-aminobenzoate synthetase component 1
LPVLRNILNDCLRIYIHQSLEEITEMSSSTVYLHELPYSPDSSGLFSRVRHLPHALLLDSSFPHSQAGRYDILTADPEFSFDFNQYNSDSYENTVKSFAKLSEIHSSFFAGVSAPAEELPFCGGIAGYLGYGLGKPLQHLRAEAQPDAHLHVYNWAVIQDHLLQRCTFTALPALSRSRRKNLLDLLREPLPVSCARFQLEAPFQSNLTADEYRDAFQKIQRYILEGDCYQVNLAQRFTAPFSGDSWSAYQTLRPLAAAPFAAYMQSDAENQILCLSPERFLSLHGHTVETRPIKGTRPRHKDPETDALAAQELRMSPKDRAENLMIVDLLRNDMGRNCVAGSIHVDSLFRLESFPTVHHLVSTISGELIPGRNAYDLLRDSFPGGSITGAPKRRAMEIIEELEPDYRQAYCGSRLYVSADGRMDSNIAIRTLQCSSGNIYCWGGGGIVADSDWQREYQETYDKVGGFLRALESGAGVAA